MKAFPLWSQRSDPDKEVCEMKTVYILTFAGSVNYGAALQGYALYKTVSDMGYSCKVIDYNRTIHHKNYILPSFRQSSLKGKLLKLLTSGDRRELSRKFDSFVENNETLTRAFNGCGSLHRVYWDPNDIYLLGSDQVFNLGVTGGDFHYYLDFVESPNKIAYAPSFGTNNFPEQYGPRVEELLGKFRYITVREESGARLIEEVAGMRPQTVLDPTFLLSAEEWDCIAKKPKEQDYVLSFPFRKDSSCIEAAKSYAENTVSTLVNITYMVNRVEGAVNVKNLSPEEWLGYIAHAGKVFTDSFHGMVFSLIFQKDFVISLDKENQKQSRNSRVIDLLSRIGAEGILRGLEPNYDLINAALGREIRKSKAALIQMLTDVNEKG